MPGDDHYKGLARVTFGVASERTLTAQKRQYVSFIENAKCTLTLHADIIISRTESFCFDRPSYDICILQTNVLCNK